MNHVPGENSRWVRIWVLRIVIGILSSDLPDASAQVDSAFENTEASGFKGFLWEVSGSSNVVFLLGTLWVRTNETAPVNLKMREAYEKSGVLVVPFTPEEAESVGLSKKRQEYGKYPIGETVREHLSKLAYEGVESMHRGATNDWQQNRPWFIGEEFVGIMLRMQGYGGTNTIERHFLARAKDDRKPVHSLEAPDARLDVVRRLSDVEQELMLAEAWNEMLYFSTNAHLVYKTWEQGDVEKMDGINRYHLERIPMLTKKLVYDRNRAWMPKIESYLRSGTNTLVIVPARNLVGYESLIRLLEEKRYKVRQL